RSIPPEIGQLTNLTSLYLENNSESLNLPAHIYFKDNLIITGKCHFETKPYSKKSANIVIILDGDHQTVKSTDDGILENFYRSFGRKLPVLTSGPILEKFITKRPTLAFEASVKIPDIYQIFKLQKSDLYLLLPNNIPFRDAFDLETPDIQELEWKTFSKLINNKNGLQRRSPYDLHSYLKDKWLNYNQDNWLNGIKKIFKNGTDYWWNISLNGHGSIESKTIAGLTNNDFKKLIDFLRNPESKLNVFFFDYDTCYGGGPRLITPYSIKKKQLQDIKPVPFFIVSASTRATTSHAHETNYTKLFYQLEAILNYTELDSNQRSVFGHDPIDSLLKSIKTTIPVSNLTSNFPLIKFPGSKFFMSVRKDSRIKVITNVLVKQKKLLDDPFFLNKHRKTTQQVVKNIVVKEDVKSIFVFPNIIDVPVMINTKEPPFFVSLDPGHAMHFFKEINAPDIKESEIFDLFINKDKEYKHRETGKIFIIKKLTHGHDKVAYNNVVLDAESGGIFYEKDGYFYKKETDYYSYVNMKIVIGKTIQLLNKNEFKKQITDFITNWSTSWKELFKTQLKGFAPWQTPREELIDYINEQLGTDIKLQPLPE
ncbi:hypothetical protein KAT92_01875, partial [Candidatus Babeliales bacterium]|nr:hypothetical protein [Candidatus Babeliales bacterium]